MGTDTPMISSHVINIAVEYLDGCAATNQRATLVGMLWHVDGRNKTLPLVEEVNEALKQRPSICVERVDSLVLFGLHGSERAITVEDMRGADKQYRKEFAAALRRLQK